MPIFAGFENWFRGPGSAVAASTHQISNFSYLRTGDNSFNMKMDFDWQGILPDGKEMVAKTRHSWAVEDNVTERVARIKTPHLDRGLSAVIAARFRKLCPKPWV